MISFFLDFEVLLRLCSLFGLVMCIDGLCQVCTGNLLLFLFEVLEIL